jgi:hypothetical protein
LLWAVAAQAAVKLSNLETAATGTATVSAVNYKAQPFRTTASGPFEITLVTRAARNRDDGPHEQLRERREYHPRSGSRRGTETAGTSGTETREVRHDLPLSLDHNPDRLLHTLVEIISKAL